MDNQRSINRSIKVMHLISQLEKGGAETMLHKLLTASCANIHEHFVVSLADDGYYGRVLRERGFQVHCLGFRRRIPNPFKFLKLLRIVYSTKPDVIQSWLYHADLIGLIVAKLFRKTPIVWNIRCSNVDWKNYSRATGLLVKILSWLSPLPSAIVANSTAGLKHHQKLGYQNANWNVIPNGFDIDTFTPSAGARKYLRNQRQVSIQAPLIGIVARFDALKDLGTFVRAALLLQQNMPNAQFVMIGRGLASDNTELMQFFEGASHTNFHFLGERDDVAQLVAGLDVFTLTSKSEGFPNVVGEAMACAVACVVTDVGDCAELVGDCGIVVPVGDAEQIAAGWQKLLELSPDERTSLGAKARSRIVRNYSISNILRQYETLYTQLIPSQSERFELRSPVDALR